MKKQIATLTLLLLTFVAFGQYNDYDRGFKNGYKEGYCYNDFGCISPIPPITPIPLIGESRNNFVQHTLYEVIRGQRILMVIGLKKNQQKTQQRNGGNSGKNK